MSAKQAAIKDIKESLKKSHKAFIAFHRELDNVMAQLVKEQLRMHELAKYK